MKARGIALGMLGEDVLEILWLPADSCTVVSGDPDGNLIPAWWYD